VSNFSIGEIEKLTGIKAHILRYWEEVVPSLTPQKDLGGRRTYSQRDVQIILRLKHLIQEKKFTIEGARNQLIAEMNMSESVADLMQNINQIKGDLLDIYKLIQSRKTNEHTENSEN
jgi:DNA-binding transcriptional MerR regulator